MGEWECTECGYVTDAEQPPRRCPECGAPAEHFRFYEFDDLDEELEDEDFELEDPY